MRGNKTLIARQRLHIILLYWENLTDGIRCPDESRQMFDKIPISHKPEETKIALLAGGSSGERPISLKSAEGAKEALEQAGYQVTQLDPAEAADLKALIDGGFDVAFLALHGKGGEDGAIQGFLQTIGLPYTCSGIWGSAVAIDKTKAKVFYREEGIPTPAGMTIARGDAYDVADVVAKLGDKVAVKAATEGSSIGVYIVEGADEIGQALKDGLDIDTKVLVEQFVKGTELTCVVMGSGDSAQALPVIEIIPQNASYDFESKYAPGGSEHVCPARIDDASTAAVQKHAVAAHNALGCEGVTRTDFLLEENGDMWALETNTVPGMTATSLLPDAARAVGVSFPELATMMVQMALDADR